MWCGVRTCVYVFLWHPIEWNCIQLTKKNTQIPKHETTQTTKWVQPKPHLSSLKLAKLPFQISHQKRNTIHCGTNQNDIMRQTSNSWFISLFFILFSNNNHNATHFLFTILRMEKYSKQANTKFPNTISVCFVVECVRASVCVRFISNETNDNHCNYNNTNDNIGSISIR